MYDAYIYDIYTQVNVCLMHVSKMQIYMILDPDACVYDADINDAYVHDP